VIYLDSSVLLSQLLAEDRQPAQSLWDENLVSSRLLEYEVWSRIHIRGLSRTHAEQARIFIEFIDLIGLSPNVLERALEPFPIPVRTLDALHLATIEYARLQGDAVQLASFDKRMIAAARALGIELYDF
jgi:predicted nucleic acid-binding protein